VKPKLTDPNDVKRLTPDVITKRLTPGSYDIIVNRVKRVANAKVNWINYLFNTILWAKVKKNVRWNKKTLYFILANFDELVVFMPTPFWIEVVKLIDKIGEGLYKDLKAEGK